MPHMLGDRHRMQGNAAYQITSNSEQLHPHPTYEGPVLLAALHTITFPTQPQGWASVAPAELGVTLQVSLVITLDVRPLAPVPTVYVRLKDSSLEQTAKS
jgi:hypothetical protein